jgi:hypothetical protein
MDEEEWSQQWREVIQPVSWVGVGKYDTVHIGMEEVLP